ncbi:putative membrane protein YeiH [Filimonas zeae]|uniref:Membrane protein n=1 Tax=Filimonas zeae TaxID=1737353 RepID=A0A917J072_9BACT|nr:trimeric intracellular cation channel family protein [Filimonas zeae]MDR6340568.1 putative membrane protein YeiH [Filimonas zeae]GGH73342.1 membrane protein [Filimonas zeae]
MSYTYIIEVVGTIAFAVSGAVSAINRRYDLLGVLMMAFVTAIGGGTLRDVLIGNTPVTWLRDMNTPAIILATGFATILFRRHIKNFQNTLLIFDALGLGFFTIIGIQKGLAIQLHPAIGVALGTITGCFGGVLRDVLLNTPPALFHKEVYATACIVGGSFYCIALRFLPAQMAESLSIVLILTIRILAVKLHWKLPSIGPDITEDGA